MIKDPGKMNRRIQIERRAQAPGQFGHPVDAWSPVASAWASFRPVSAKEQISASAVQASLTHTFMIRYKAGLAGQIEAAQWRIVYAGRTFNVLASRELSDGRQHIIFDCQEGGADGH